MKSEFDYIQNILTDKQPFCVQTDNSKNYHLIEIQDNVANRKGQIQNILINDNNFKNLKLYKFDIKTPDPFPFLNSENKTLPKEVRSFCDYFAICTYNKTFYIILFELKAIRIKKNLPDEKKKAKSQLQISECFAKYIIDLANTTKDKNKSEYKEIETYTFSNDSILKCIIISIIDNNSTSTINTNQKKSKKKSVFQNEGNNVYSGIFKLQDELILEDLFN